MDKPVTECKNYALIIIFWGWLLYSIAMTLSLYFVHDKSIGMVFAVLCSMLYKVSFLSLSVFMARAKVLDVYDYRGTNDSNNDIICRCFFAVLSH